MSRLSSPEIRRKFVHAGMGLFALALKWLTWRQAALCAAAALAFNLFAMPAIGRGIYRDVGRKRDAGIVSYAAMVLALILLFRNRLEIAAAVWGMLAFGDPAAEIAGRTLGGPRLPWNREKTWTGFFACLVVGGLAGTALYLFVSGAPVEGDLLVALAAASFAFAFLESVRAGIEDNLVAPLPAAIVLLGLLEVGAFVQWRLPLSAVPESLAGAVLINGLVALAGAFLGVVSRSGAVAGFVIGTLILVLGGAGHYAVLWTFFLLGTLATKLGYRAKAARGTAQEAGGRRGAAHVLANCGVPVAILLCWPVPVVYVAAFAAALADTLGTEVGTLSRRRPISPLTFRALPPGTPGAVSLAGTLAGLAGAAAVGLVAAWTRVIVAPQIIVVALAGAAGSWLESALVDLGRRRGFRLDHEFANAFNTFAGAVVAWILIDAVFRIGYWG